MIWEPSRSLISQLALDISRYENGSKEGLLQSFNQLTGHNALKQRLGALTPETLLNFIKNSDFMQAAKQNEFANQLAQSPPKPCVAREAQKRKTLLRKLCGLC